MLIEYQFFSSLSKFGQINVLSIILSKTHFPTILTLSPITLPLLITAPILFNILMFNNN